MLLLNLKPLFELEIYINLGPVPNTMSQTVQSPILAYKSLIRKKGVAAKNNNSTSNKTLEQGLLITTLH